MTTITRKNSKLGNYMHYSHASEARGAGVERILVGYQQVVTGHEQVQIGEDESGPIFEDGAPIYGDDKNQPIYEDGEELFQAEWDEAWGEPPSDEDLANWEEPEPDPPTPVTDVEKLQQGIRTYREANEAAKEIIFTLMVKVAGALMAFELFTEDNVNAEGARFVAFHREPILDYKTAGRNAVSAQALYASVASDASKAAFPWLEGGTGPTFLKLFASELGVTP